MKRVLVCAALLAWAGLASAVVYKWSDAQGKIQYGDRPPDGVHAEVVELPGSRVPRSQAARPADAPQARPAPAGSKSTPQGASAPDSPTQQAVTDDVAQSREKQCTDAQERYKKLIEGRKLYKTGANGERQYLTSDEIDAERLGAKQDVDTACNSPT